MQIALASGTLVASVSDSGFAINERGSPTYVFKAGATKWTEVQPAVRLSGYLYMMSVLHVHVVWSEVHVNRMHLAGGCTVLEDKPQEKV